MTSRANHRTLSGQRGASPRRRRHVPTLCAATATALALTAPASARQPDRGVASSTRVASAGTAGRLGNDLSSNPSTWTLPQALSSPSVKATGPRLAVAANGDATVMWRQRSASGVVRMVASTRFGGGPWSSPTSVSGGGTANKTQHALAMNPVGGAVAVWRSGRQIQFSRHLSGSGWTPHKALTGTTRPRFGPDVAMDSRGDVTVVWSELVTTSKLRRWVVKAVQRHPGGGWGHPFEVSGKLARHHWDYTPQVAMDERGDVTVAWLRGYPVEISDNCPGLMTRRRAAASGHWGKVSGLGGSCVVPWVRMNPAGNTAIAWMQDAYEGADQTVHEAVRPVGGVWHFHGERLGNSSQSLGGVAIDDNGDVVVAWQKCGASVCSVLTRRRPASGPWDAPVNIAQGAYPRVAMSADGTTTFIWQDPAPKYGWGALRSMQRTPTGEWGPVESVSTETPADRSEMLVGMASVGDAVAVWTEVIDGIARVMVSST